MNGLPRESISTSRPESALDEKAITQAAINADEGLGLNRCVQLDDTRFGRQGRVGSQICNPACFGSAASSQRQLRGETPGCGRKILPSYLAIEAGVDAATPLKRRRGRRIAEVLSPDTRQ